MICDGHVGVQLRAHAQDTLCDGCQHHCIDADVRDVPHAVLGACSVLAGSSIRRAAVEVGLLRAPPKAVPLATIHAEALPRRAPAAHAAAPHRRVPSELRPKNSARQVVKFYGYWVRAQEPLFSKT